MVRDYVEDALPAGGRPGRHLTADAPRRRPATRCVPHPAGAPWHQRAGGARSTPTSRGRPGRAVVQVDATVALGELAPDEVEVQLVGGHVGQTGELEHPHVVADDRRRLDRRPSPALRRHRRRSTWPVAWE